MCWCWWWLWARRTCRPPPTCTSSTWRLLTSSCVLVRKYGKTDKQMKMYMAKKYVIVADILGYDVHQRYYLLDQKSWILDHTFNKHHGFCNGWYFPLNSQESSKGLTSSKKDIWLLVVEKLPRLVRSSFHSAVRLNLTKRERNSIECVFATSSIRTKWS